MVKAKKRLYPPKEEPLWYKDAVIYEVAVKAYYDSDGNGIGDFRGLAEKLDYLVDLGITALWLLPFYPSPLKDDGYDIADYMDIHPSYGTLQDFKYFLKEAHTRNIRIITELVINHTSDQHSWFQRARRAKPGSSLRNFYVWSDTVEKYRDARIIFKDFETSNWTWDPIANAYYWHRFYSHQPDLNFDNPDVHKAIFQIADFWLEMGIDGMRLDAVPYLYERDGTDCENLPETHAFLKKMRSHIDKNFKNRMILAEANQWPEDAIHYFNNGDECHMAFHFPLMPRLFMALHMEDRYPIIDILQQTPAIPESCQWALFLRNHDELTLEMVTDEDRDYMYRVYTRDPKAKINLGIRHRLMPLLGNNRRRVELMNALLFFLPGTPVIYYGDEIGMGDNIYLGDRNGVRSPMQWSSDKNAGFSRANPQKLYLPIIISPEYHYEAINIEIQSDNTSSLFWWMKRLIALRKRFKAFGRGSIEFLQPINNKILAFLRCYQDENILVIANLSRFVQFAELDLSAFNGKIPVELFGSTQFPAVSDKPYLITLGPHSFYLMMLKTPKVKIEPTEQVEKPVPVIEMIGDWIDIFDLKNTVLIEEALTDYLKKSYWFRGKMRNIREIKVFDTIVIPYDSNKTSITLLSVEYLEGEPEIYILPFTFKVGKYIGKPRAVMPETTIAILKDWDTDLEGVLYEASDNRDFCITLLEAMAFRRRFKSELGEIIASPTHAFTNSKTILNSLPEPSILKTKQNNTSVLFGDKLILKFFRRTEKGVNPDLEIGRFLTEHTDFEKTPALLGSLEYKRGDNGTATLGLLYQYVTNEGSFWQYTLDCLVHYFDSVMAHQKDFDSVAIPQNSILELTKTGLPEPVRELIGSYVETVNLLGKRTAELHLALTSDNSNLDFAPEPFSQLYQRSLYQYFRNLTSRALRLLKTNFNFIPSELKAQAQVLLSGKEDLIKLFSILKDRKFTTMRIRTHGDYHLGQILFTGKDFEIIDFEGDPTRPLDDRRLKRSPLLDVAGMLYSFKYAAYRAYFHQKTSGLVSSEKFETLELWTRFWVIWVSSVFLGSYLKKASPGQFLPTNDEELQSLLNIYSLEKALYELIYKLNNRLSQAKLPLEEILRLIKLK